MTCSTCHDVHTVERNAAVLSARCLECHQPLKCQAGQRSKEACASCHMPLERSKKIVVQTYRDHRIAIHRSRP